MSVARQPAEALYARELHALASADAGPRPAGWKLSPASVRTFVVGSDGKALSHEWEGESVETEVSRKFYGDDPLVDRCIVTLMGERGLMLVGEPGTAKSMLSELLAAAISGSSTNTIQGTAGTTEDQIKYSWNYARLLAEGPSVEAMVASPLYIGLDQGLVTRFEEVTRCQPEIQDTLISVLSEKMLHVPELADEKSVLFARKGFNVVATANLRDRGVHEMSSALKRRFNFETVRPLDDPELERELVLEKTRSLLGEAEAPVDVGDDVIDVLVTTFHDLRTGKTRDGTVVDRPTAVMSTAEAVAVGVSAGLDAHYFGKGRLEGEHLVRQLRGTVLKDEPEDARKLRQYFDVVVKARSRKSAAWKSAWGARRWLEK